MNPKLLNALRLWSALMGLAFHVIALVYMIAGLARHSTFDVAAAVMFLLLSRSP